MSTCLIIQYCDKPINAENNITLTFCFHGVENFDYSNNKSKCDKRLELKLRSVDYLCGVCMKTVDREEL